MSAALVYACSHSFLPFFEHTPSLRRLRAGNAQASRLSSFPRYNLLRCWQRSPRDIASTMPLSALAIAAACCVLLLVSAAPLSTGQEDAADHTLGACFPSLDFVKPFRLPKNNTDWWCDMSTEYAFVGFSYEVTDCEYTVLRSGLWHWC